MAIVIKLNNNSTNGKAKTLLYTKGLLIRELGLASKRRIKIAVNKESSTSSFEKQKKDSKTLHYVGDGAILMAVIFNSDLLRYVDNSKIMIIEVAAVSKTGRNLLLTIDRFNKSRHGNTTANK